MPAPVSRDRKNKSVSGHGSTRMNTDEGFLSALIRVDRCQMLFRPPGRDSRRSYRDYTKATMSA